jgi:hypothetical protein
MWAWIVVGVLASACGRFSFDPIAGGDGGDAQSGLCAITITPDAIELNVNSRTTFAVSGNRSPATFSIEAGPGTVVDTTGAFFSPSAEATTTILAVDNDGCEARAVATTRGSTLFYVGGVDLGQVPHSDVYSSPDGITWTTIGALPGTRYYGRLVVFEDRMWWLGGELNAEVFSSTDGITWRDEAPLPGPRYQFTALVVGERIVIVAGYDGVANLASVIATSDGVTWNTIGTLPLPMHGAKCVLYADEILCLGGHRPVGRVGDVQASNDGGQTWVNRASLPFLIEEQASIVVGSRIILAGGTDDLADSDAVRTSDDGVSWTTQPMLPAPRYITDFVLFHGRVWMVGAGPVMSTTDGSQFINESSMPTFRAGGGLVTYTPR